MNGQFIPEETISSLPVADITIAQDKEVMTTNYQYPVKRPAEYQNEFMVLVKASNLQKVREVLLQAKSVKFPIHEVLLGISSISIGATLGALSAGIKLDTFLGKLMYVLCPLITVGSFVSYVFTRRDNLKSVKDFADEIEEYIVDPEKTN